MGAVGDEVDALGAALSSLGADVGVGVDVVEVLADHPGRRRVVRVGDVVVKAFSSVEVDAFSREVAGLRAVASSGLAVPLVSSGERWTATAWVDGVPPISAAVGNEAIHVAIGSWLARLHAVEPVGLRPQSVVDRLRARLTEPPSACPPALVAAVGGLIEPLLGCVAAGVFVHGDWGTARPKFLSPLAHRSAELRARANVLVDRAAPLSVLAIIDFEDAHLGDPAEDFKVGAPAEAASSLRWGDKWQVLAGSGSGEVDAMAAGYVAAGGSLGANAVERLVVAGAELCLDVLGWDLAGEHRARFHGRCIATLDDLVSGDWPAGPG